MPPAKRRKVTSASNPQPSTSQEILTGITPEAEKPQKPEHASEDMNPMSANGEPAEADKNKERQERFKALQARAVSQSIPISHPAIH